MAQPQDKALFGAFVGIESAHFFSAWLPSLMTIQKFANDPEAVAALRKGEIIAAGFAVGLGWTVSQLINDETPLVASVLTALFMIMVYEAGIRGKLNGTGTLAFGAAAALPWVPP